MKAAPKKAHGQMVYRAFAERAEGLHEIKLDNYRMAARIDNGRAQLVTRTGLDWAARYPSAIAALASVNAKTAYLDGELCGVDDAGPPSFAQTQAATDDERGVYLVYYAFDLLHFDGRDVSALPLRVLQRNRREADIADRAVYGAIGRTAAARCRRVDGSTRQKSGHTP